MKKLFSPIIPFVLTAVFCVSCSQEKETAVETFAISAYLDTIIQDWEGRDVFTDEYKRLTGIDLTITQPPHQQYMEKLMVSFSDSDAPDVCEVLPEYMSLMISRDIPLALDDYIKNSVHISKMDKALLESLRAPDGSIYGVPARDGGGCVTYIRKDWLDNLGLPVPRTWDEFVQTLRAFTFDDPDGNGIDDTRGYTDVASGGFDWYNRAVMLDARMEIHYTDGRWIDGFTEKNTKTALNRLKEIYNEGLCDPNIATNTTFTARNRFFSGDVGVITYWGNHWARNMQERTRKSSSPRAEVVPIPPLDDGYYIRRVAPLLMLTGESEDPERVFINFIDKQFDKSGIQTLFTYGVQGFHWDYIDGEATFLPNEKDPFGASYTKAFVPPAAVINDWNQPMPLDELVLPALKILSVNSRQERLKYGGEYYSKYYLEIDRVLKPEIISRIISGELSVDEGIEEYDKRAAELYVDQILAELNGESSPR